MEQTESRQAIGQKYLGSKSLIFYLVLLGMFAALSTDLYLPALPTMARYFNVSEVLTNLTIILFFVCFSLAMLFWGPLSDKYGRRPMLLVGLVVYTLASISCAFSFSITMLIVSRVVQSVGAGAASAISMAIVKDVYEGKRLERTLAIIQSISVVGPVAAPLIGGLLLKITDWRGAFFVQTFFGVVVVVFGLLMSETIHKKSNFGLAETMGRLFVVLKNKRFTVILLIFSALSVTFMAFISVSSYIYENYFGLSSQAYSLFFSLNAIMMLFGPMLYMKCSAHFTRFTLINASFIVTVASGVMICLFGRFSPWFFALTLLPSTIAGSFIAPPSRFLALSQQSEDTGSASSLINAFGAITGSLGMMVASLKLGDLILVIGVLNIVMGLVCGVAWLFVTSRPLLKDLRGVSER